MTVLSPCLVAADIGGTFTDLIARLPDGRLAARKVLSTPDDYSRAIAEGLSGLLAEAGVPPEAVREVCHGTTLGTNAVIERRGARTGLITTAGFRDVLEIRRIRFPDAYNPRWVKPEPLVPRELRLEIAERIAADGAIVRAPDEAEVNALAATLQAAGVDAIAIALINAHANPDHEEWLADRLAARLPGCSITVASRLLPEIGEYERTSTAVANAYLAPIMGAYLARLRDRLTASGAAAPIFVAQSNGGLYSAAFAARRPFLTLESGPAAGCVAARGLARECGYDRLIALDMGGTTTKASFVAGGEVATASEFEIGMALSQSTRLSRGGGYTIRCPVVDLAEVGAGGGSLARVDPAGVLHVGPRSAGASPGPACYGLGGQEATLTDANVVLGYINPRSLAGGRFAIDPDLARAAVERVAAQIGKSVDETAHGIHAIANSAMMAAIRAVSTQRGRDVRRVDLLAFGGSGPVQAVGLAAALAMRRVIVPPLPGLFSSFGLLIADIEHHAMRGFLAHWPAVDLDRLNAVLGDMQTEVEAELREAGYGFEAVTIERSAAIKLAERSGEVVPQLPDGPVGPDELADLERRFLAEYRDTYRHLPAGATPEILNLRLVGRVRRDVGGTGAVFAAARPEPGPDAGTRRDVYFGPRLGRLATPVIGRGDLAGEVRPGPLIVEEADSSTVIHPGWRARLDDRGNIVIEREA